MRPPLRVEAKVAEELRNWLTSELGRLDASDTNPFAHHVVTILLQEDADFDDEPLPTNDSFDLWGSRTVRRSKTKQKQAKAAVEFLRSAISSDEAKVESEIEDIINQLMVRIEATKQTLDHKKSHGRDLLGVLTININNQSQPTSVRTDNRSYNEVFPSLPGEAPATKVTSTATVSPNNSVWNKSPPGKENSGQGKARRFPQLPHRKVRFMDEDEAQAYSVAAKVFSHTMADSSFPRPEAMEVPTSRCIEFHCLDLLRLVDDPFAGCWKSAFYALRPTMRLFTPQEGSLSLLYDVRSFARSPEKKSVVLIKNTKVPGVNAMNRDLFKIVDLLDPEAQKVFLTAEQNFKVPRPPSELYHLTSPDSEDLEVIHILQGEPKVKRIGFKNPLPICGSSADQSDEIEGALAFPDHYGDFWNDLAKTGAIAVYPDFGAGLPKDPERRRPKDDDEDTNLLGAVGGAVPGQENSDEDGSSLVCASVTFTQDLYSYAIQKMSDIGGQMHGSLAGFKTDSWEGIESRHPVPFGPIRREVPTRANIASSDSGILLQTSADSVCTSPALDPPLSAPPAFQLACSLLPRGPGPGEIMASNLQSPCMACSRGGSSTDGDLSSHHGGNGSLASWIGALEESSWDHIQRSVFPPRRQPSELDTPFHTSSSSNSNHSSLPLSQVPIPDVRDFESSLSSPNCSPLPSDTYHPMSVPPHPSHLTSGQPSSSPSAFTFPASTHLIPSMLSPGMGMENTVAQALQSAYVDNFFNNSSASHFENTSTFICVELESSWLAEENCSQVSSVQFMNTAMVKGRTCSKWLEGNCELGAACPFSHPSL